MSQPAPDLNRSALLLTALCQCLRPPTRPPGGSLLALRAKVHAFGQVDRSAAADITFVSANRAAAHQMRDEGFKTPRVPAEQEEAVERRSGGGEQGDHLAYGLAAGKKVARETNWREEPAAELRPIVVGIASRSREMPRGRLRGIPAVEEKTGK